MASVSTTSTATSRPRPKTGPGRLLFPVLLIVLAILSAAALAYGMHPEVAERQGVWLLALTRRLQWLLVALTLLPCLGLLALVVSGHRRSVWLLGLLPVLALFYLRFGTHRQDTPEVLDGPQFVDPAGPYAPAEAEWIVGVWFADNWYALPYRALAQHPVVLITDYDQRMLVMWSAQANRAVAYRVGREIRSRDLEVTARCADAWLIYNRWLGEFICSVTGQTLQGNKPHGFLDALVTTKTTWGQWRRAHPSTRLMLPPPGADLPTSPIPGTLASTDPALPAEQRIMVVFTQPPLAIAPEHVQGDLTHLAAGPAAALILRDPKTQQLRAFDRRMEDDLFPRFKPFTSSKHPQAMMQDSDSLSLWTAQGVAIDGEWTGRKLTPLPLDTDLAWPAMNYWYPDLVFSAASGQK